ncbi:hypothetical protein F5880DRAFT_1462618, partial [Lentinula raphanica]
ISPSTLDSLPHLREKVGSTGDQHIDETLRTRKVYLKEQNLDALVDLFQSQSLPEPLPRTIWKLILKDEYVSFEKLLAGIDPSYDHQDEGKDFGAGYTLVKTDHLSAKKPVVSESDWNRAFDAWRNGVIQAYPHRRDELVNYGQGISHLFRNFAHDPSIPIRADHEVRERYHKSPFRLDDGNRTQAAVMALVHRTSVGVRSKRPSDAGPSSRSSKRSSGAICLNWNGDLETLQTSNRVQEALQGPRTLRGEKRKAAESSAASGPRFKRGFVWEDSDEDIVSPSVLSSETAAPLPGPPSHVTNDPVIVRALSEHNDLLKGESHKARVITDQTASGLNAGVHREDAHVRYDDMRSFGAALRQAKKRNPGKNLVLFKDDVKGAFPTLPAHPIWQLKQVVKVDDSFHINLVMFHGRLRPRRQVLLLIFWDYIHCPYEDEKQDAGPCLKIIGFFINICAGTISITDDSIKELIVQIQTFLNHSSRKPPLRQWMRLCGHINWALNVLPWARPAL